MNHEILIAIIFLIGFSPFIWAGIGIAITLIFHLFGVKITSSIGARILYGPLDWIARK